MNKSKKVLKIVKDEKDVKRNNLYSVVAIVSVIISLMSLTLFDNFYADNTLEGFNLIQVFTDFDDIMLKIISYSIIGISIIVVIVSFFLLVYKYIKYLEFKNGYKIFYIVSLYLLLVLSIAFVFFVNYYLSNHPTNTTLSISYGSYINMLVLLIATQLITFAK